MGCSRRQLHVLAVRRGFCLCLSLVSMLKTEMSEAGKLWLQQPYFPQIFRFNIYFQSYIWAIVCLLQLSCPSTEFSGRSLETHTRDPGGDESSAEFEASPNVMDFRSNTDFVSHPDRVSFAELLLFPPAGGFFPGADHR